jgi:hypothetical protein
VAERRELTFAELGEVMPEVRRLLGGYVGVGRWSLGQVCHHLATSLKLIIDGGLVAASPRKSDALKVRFFRHGRFPDGAEAPFPVLLPPAGLDDMAEADALALALDRFASAPGPFPPHPVLGPLTRDEWARFHCMHAAHHLGFFAPDDHSLRSKPE